MKLRVIQILGILVILIACMFTTKANFADLATEIQYRYNPLAARANPLRNPAANIGISEADAATITKVTTAALRSKPNY